MAEQDLYDILGVSRDATEKQIDRAYRRLARKYHPDVNPGDKQAEEKLKKIAAAHEVLSSPEKRKLYDEFGEEARKIGFDPEKARAYREWQQRARAGASFGGFDAADKASPGRDRARRLSPPRVRLPGASVSWACEWRPHR